MSATKRDYINRRDVTEDCWYYMNRSGSIDLVVRDTPFTDSVSVRISRKKLERILGDVRQHARERR